MVVSPGVDVEAFRPRERSEALLDAAALLAHDRDSARGRPAQLDVAVQDALAARDAAALDALATSYPQDVPEPGAAAGLRSLARSGDPIVGYLGKLDPAERRGARARGAASPGEEDGRVDRGVRCEP